MIVSMREENINIMCSKHNPKAAKHTYEGYDIKLSCVDDTWESVVVVDGVDHEEFYGSSKEEALKLAKNFIKRMCPYCFRYVDNGDEIKVCGYYYHTSCWREIDYN